jgi:hypothetical protein
MNLLVFLYFMLCIVECLLSLKEQRTYFQRQQCPWGAMLHQVFPYSRLSHARVGTTVEILIVFCLSKTVSRAVRGCANQIGSHASCWSNLRLFYPTKSIVWGPHMCDLLFCASPLIHHWRVCIKEPRLIDDSRPEQYKSLPSKGFEMACPLFIVWEYMIGLLIVWFPLVSCQAYLNNLLATLMLESRLFHGSATFRLRSSTSYCPADAPA